MTDYILSRITKRKCVDENDNIVDYEFMDEQGNKIENKYGFFKGAMDNCITRLKVNVELEIDPETGWFKEDNEEEIDLFDRDY